MARTAKQKAATRKLIAFNKRRRAPKGRASAPSTRRRSPPKSRAKPRRKTAVRRRRNQVSTPLPAKRRAYARTATIAAPRRRQRVRARGNPVTLAKALPDIVMPSLVGAGGAVGMDIAWGYLAAIPAVPEVLKTGWGRIGAKAITSIAIAAMMGQVKMLRDFAQPFAIGAVTVLAYETMRTFMAQRAPNVAMDGMGMYVDGLGYYSAGINAGGPANNNNNMGAYTNGPQRAPQPQQLSLYTNSRRPSASHQPASDNLGDWGGGEYNEGGYQY